MNDDKLKKLVAERDLLESKLHELLLELSGMTGARDEWKSKYEARTAELRLLQSRRSEANRRKAIKMARAMVIA
jgi:hypothetical protein